jgi:hypothetical protein
MAVKPSKVNRNAIKATMNGFLRDALRDIDVALVCMRGEDIGPALKAQREELKTIKIQLQSIIDKPGE